MKKYKSFPPYLASGKTTFPAIKEKPGVYQIFESGKLVYIGFSSNNLYRTLYRHFQRWNHRGQDVVSYETRMKRHNYTIRVTLCTPLQALKLERLLIKKYKPRDNSNQYELYELTPSDLKVFEKFKGEELIQLPDLPF